MHKYLRFCLIILSLLTGGLFIYSAYTKLDPIQSFEYTMVEFIHLPWLGAAVVARLLTGLEGGIGILIASHLFGKRKWVLKTAFTLLAVFSVYLAWLWMTAGNDVNCGCFGDAIWMTPSASLIKNGIMLGVTSLLIKYHNGITGKLFDKAAPIVAVLSIALVFILFGIPLSKPGWLHKEHYEIDFSELGIEGGSTPPMKYGPGTQLVDTNQRTDLHKGKYIIAFLSQSCRHCRIAAYKMHLLKQSNPKLPFFMIIGGTSDLTDFWKATKAQNIPYVRLDKDHFLNYTGGVFPLIIWVDDGWVEAKADYNTLNQAEIEEWLK